MPRRRDERGSGLISLLPAVLVFLIMVLVAAQVAHGLYVSTTLDAVAHDAARIGAQAGPDGGRAAASRHVASVLPGAAVEISWAGSTTEVVRLTLSVEPRRLVPVSLGFLAPERIARTAELRVERPVPRLP